MLEIVRRECFLIGRGLHPEASHGVGRNNETIAGSLLFCLIHESFCSRKGGSAHFLHGFPGNNGAIEKQKVISRSNRRANETWVSADPLTANSTFVATLRHFCRPSTDAARVRTPVFPEQKGNRSSPSLGYSIRRGSRSSSTISRIVARTP